MAKMRGFLHSKPKVDDAEWELAQSRTIERLAGLFSDAALDGTEAQAAPEAEPVAEAQAEAVPMAVGEGAQPAAAAERERPRPPIVVVDDNPTDAGQAALAKADPIGVMARPEDHFDDNGWQIPSPAPAQARPAGLPKPGRRAGSPGSTRRPRVAKPAAKSTATATVKPSAAAAATGQTAGSAAPATNRADAPAEQPAPRPRVDRGANQKRRAPRKNPAPIAAIAHCPYCAVVLEPAPTASRRCEGCRQRIVVKRVDGHPVYLTEAAVVVFEAERRRIASSARLTRERARWLSLAAAVAAPERRRTQLAAARLTDETVAASRALYLTAVDRAYRAARRDKAWDAAARIRRDQATVLYRAAGSHRPPPSDIVGLYREGVAAELRGIAEISRDAELVAASCCAACRADDHRIYRISTELRQPRLPHADCPKGLCRCHWDLAARDRTTIQRYLRRRPASDPRVVVEAAESPA